MKLAAIYSVFDGEELLEGSIKQIYDHVDIFYLIYQNVSNYGEAYEGGQKECERLANIYDKIKLVKYVPFGGNAMSKERNKRKLGLKLLDDCTHFMFVDCDEYYDVDDFGKAKEYVDRNNIQGSVCKILTYFKYPTCCYDGLDGYYVPFIHVNKRGIDNSANINYPYYVDPTRKVNVSEVNLLPIIMHHYSWVRKDISRKIRNSTARKNIESSSLLHDYVNLKEGVPSKVNGRNVIFTTNRHGIKNI